MTPLSWQTYTVNSLREYFLRPLLEDEDLTKYLSLLPPTELSKVTLGLYYVSEASCKIIPITKDNVSLLLDTLLEIIAENNKK